MHIETVTSLHNADKNNNNNNKIDICGTKLEFGTHSDLLLEHSLYRFLSWFSIHFEVRVTGAIPTSKWTRMTWLTIQYPKYVFKHQDLQMCGIKLNIFE